MSEAQRWWWLVGALLSGWLLWLLAPVLTPFLVGAVLAYIGNPLVTRLASWHLSRGVAVTVVFLLFSLLLLGTLLVLLPLLQEQFLLLAERTPRYLAWLRNEVLPWLQGWLGDIAALPDPERIERALRENWQTAGGVLGGLLESISRSGFTLLTWIANLVLVPVVTFYLLRDWDALLESLHALLPRRYAPALVRLAREADTMLGAFLRGQLLIMVLLGTLYATGLWLVGLELALLIGLLAGLVSFVPYLGVIVGVVAAGAAAAMQFQEWLPLLYVAAVFGVGQAVEGMVLQPLLIGERIGLHPVAVIFAVLAGGQLFGFFGVLLALPVAAVLAVVLRHACEHYRQSDLYGSGER